jgi:hypothetical protein
MSLSAIANCFGRDLHAVRLQRSEDDHPDGFPVIQRLEAEIVFCLGRNLDLQMLVRTSVLGISFHDSNKS